MTQLSAHLVTDTDLRVVPVNEPDLSLPLAKVHPANPSVAARVINARVDDPDGRSQWMWVRLPNGDLILGVYPQGDTYFCVEHDAHYPD